MGSQVLGGGGAQPKIGVDSFPCGHIDDDPDKGKGLVGVGFCSTYSKGVSQDLELESVGSVFGTFVSSDPDHPQLQTGV